jgi:hypothetical protein
MPVLKISGNMTHMLLALISRGLDPDMFPCDRG